MNSHTRTAEKTFYRLMKPLFDPKQFVRAIPRYLSFYEDLRHYSKMAGSEPIKFENIHPQIQDKTKITSFDSHYFYQDIWAFKKICAAKLNHHVDVGSRIDLAGFLTAITDVTFIDIRPLLVDLDNFDSRKGSILSLPFENDSVRSLSCLHVAEHVGLGRYGDSLDPLGTRKACKELARVLAENGDLYFSLPVGKHRLCFNAHRIHTPKQIMDYFANLYLCEFSGINDAGRFVKNADMAQFESMYYACGLFHFRKKD